MRGAWRGSEVVKLTRFVPSRLDIWLASFVFPSRAFPQPCLIVFFLHLILYRISTPPQHHPAHISRLLSWTQTRNTDPRAVWPSATFSPLRGAGTMVQPRLAPCIKLAFRSPRSRNFSSARDAAPLPPSVAHLLATPPPDPSNVVVNGFIRSLRSQKQRAFASIGDGSSLEPLQAILTPEQAKRCETCIYMI